MAQIIDTMHDLEDENAELKIERQRMIAEIEQLRKDVDGLRSRLAFTLTSGVARIPRIRKLQYQHQPQHDDKKQSTCAIM